MRHALKYSIPASAVPKPMAGMIYDDGDASRGPGRVSNIYPSITFRVQHEALLNCDGSMIVGDDLPCCEYVRPTLNAPLKQWEPAGGYRFSNLAPPEANNSDSLFIVASFSGGGTRASTLAF